MQLSDLLGCIWYDQWWECLQVLVSGATFFLVVLHLSQFQLLFVVEERSTKWLLPCRMLQGPAGIFLLFNIYVKNGGKTHPWVWKKVPSIWWLYPEPNRRWRPSSSSQKNKERKESEQNCAEADAGGFDLSNSWLYQSHVILLQGTFHGSLFENHTETTIDGK